MSEKAKSSQIGINRVPDARADDKLHLKNPSDAETQYLCFYRESQLQWIGDFMTKAEHALMISMFVKHQMFIKMIIEVLKSNGLVSGDDLPAFEFRVNTDAPGKAELFEAMTTLYVGVATKLGIETGIKI